MPYTPEALLSVIRADMQQLGCHAVDIRLYRQSSIDPEPFRLNGGPVTATPLPADHDHAKSLCQKWYKHAVRHHGCRNALFSIKWN